MIIVKLVEHKQKKGLKLIKPFFISVVKVSGWQDSNLRPPRPKRGAITGLRYTPKIRLQI